MEYALSKRSCLTSTRTLDQTLTRGHHSEITAVKRRAGGHRTAAHHSSRQMFTFKGSQAKTHSHNASKQRRQRSAGPRTPASGSPRTTSGAQPPAAAAKRVRSSRGVRSSSRARSASRKRTPASTRSRSRSMGRRTASHPRPSHAAASAAGSAAVASLRASTQLGSHAAFEPNSLLLRPPAPPPLPNHSVGAESTSLAGVHQRSPSATLVKTEDSKLVVSSPLIRNTNSDECAKETLHLADDDEDDKDDDDGGDPNAATEWPKSPSLCGYTKMVFNESANRWIEHVKMEEDLKRARRRKKQEALQAKMAAKVRRPPHKVKGRSTARMQVMFPTAIIKLDQQAGFVNHINMTDELRLELHKRKAPVVPTYFQEHILRHGKLPFRNNPRPHRVV